MTMDVTDESVRAVPGARPAVMDLPDPFPTVRNTKGVALASRPYHMMTTLRPQDERRFT